MSDHGDVVVHSEQDEFALELLAAGRPLADSLGAAMTGFVAGSGGLERARGLITHGADAALLLAVDESSTDLDHTLAALEQVARERHPGVILIAATGRGTELAARLAQRLGVGCAGDCTALSMIGGKLHIERTILGRFLCRQIIESRPAIATVQPRRFTAPDASPDRQGPVARIEAARPAPRLRVLGVRLREAGGVRIDKSEVVVAVGRGLRSREDLAMIEDLARALGGVVGASRPLTDDLRWLPPEAKVGLSGVTVRPRLYVACGISGQIEHNVGMREAGIVVAINSDPNAPMMSQADYRVVADLYEVVPALTRALDGLS
jgi:electron transfer flavoprotein alpha subunit